MEDGVTLTEEKVKLIQQLIAEYLDTKQEAEAMRLVLTLDHLLGIRR